MALFNLFCIQGSNILQCSLHALISCTEFINRQMADVSVRRSHHVASKAAEEEEEQLKKVTSALEYDFFPLLLLMFRLNIWKVLEREVWLD